MHNDYKKSLQEGIAELGVNISERAIAQLLEYHQLLIKWNKAYNLTAIRDPQLMISRHLLDSLSLAEYISGQRFIDIGTGAGLPGIVLAIIFPDKHFSLLDRNGKKTRFLFQVKTELGLDNIEIYNMRVEQYKTDELYDGILSRAFASLSDMVKGSKQLLNTDGCFYAMKGLVPEEELLELADNIVVIACQQLRVPGEEGQRHLVEMAVQA